MPVKYKEYYQKMLAENQALFAKFKDIHTRFSQDRCRWSEEYNLVGRDVVDVIRDWERRLCSGMGKGQFSQYSYRLADKFWEAVRKDFALIDLVGVKIKSNKVTTSEK